MNMVSNFDYLKAELILIELSCQINMLVKMLALIDIALGVMIFTLAIRNDGKGIMFAIVFG